MCVGGTVDIGQFLAVTAGMFRPAPGRAGGSALGLLSWLALTALAVTLPLGKRAHSGLNGARWVASLWALGSLALAAVHPTAGVGGPRPALGTPLSSFALALVVLVRGH
jgi:hypothetical protein